MLVLVFGSVSLQIGCDSPHDKKVQDKEQQQSEASNDHDASTTDYEIVSGPREPLLGPDTPVKARSLFDGKTLDGWEPIEFGGEGDIAIVDGTIHMYAGDPLTGICVTDETELPKTNYEFSLEGMKLEGIDFFASVTFPVNDTFCTLVVGGWGGSLVGLSNLDGRDASDNGTRVMKKFEKDRWYAVRIQVLPDRIVAWIDDEKLVDESIEGVEVSIRNDVITTTPLGITNFATSSAIRNIKLRKLD